MFRLIRPANTTVSFGTLLNLYYTPRGMVYVWGL